MRGLINKLYRDEAATTAWEYALIASLVMIGIVSAVTSFGVATSRPFQQVGNALAP